MNNDDISHFSTIPASFAIKSNVYFITNQYLIINNSQSQRALSVSVRTVLWIYFASRRNCGLLPAYCADWKKHVSTRWRNSRGAGSFTKQNTTEPNASRRIEDSYRIMQCRILQLWTTHVGELTIYFAKYDIDIALLIEYQIYEWHADEWDIIQYEYCIMGH